MGRTEVTATVTGPKGSKEFRFLVDTGATYLGLPQTEIDALGLAEVPDGWVEVLTGTGAVRRETYWGIGKVLGQGFAATVIPASLPVIGYRILENLRFRVNPVAGAGTSPRDTSAFSVVSLALAGRTTSSSTVWSPRGYQRRLPRHESRRGSAHGLDV